MLVKEVMTKNVIGIDLHKTAFDACNLYKDKKVGCLLVTDKGDCVGIVTERDIIERIICLQKNPEETKVEEIMSKDIKTVHALDKLEKAVEIMTKNNIKKLPVIQDDEIVGIITITDISKIKPELSKRFTESWVVPTWDD
jgi:CBS domain-containing protein